MSELILVQQEPIPMTQLVEIPVPNATQRQQLPDIQQLRSQEGQRIIIKKIELVTEKVLTHAITLGLINAPLAELRKMSLTLYSEGWERGYQQPILFYNNMADADAANATTIPYSNQPVIYNDWQSVDWPKSYLIYANGQVAAGTPYAVILNVTYLRLDAKGDPLYLPR